MESGTIAVLVVVVFVALVIFYMRIHGRARQTDEVIVTLDVEQVVEAIEQCFGPMWKEWNGSALINMKRRTGMGSVTKVARENGGLGPVVSVDVEPSESGGSVISVWMGWWFSQFGIPYLAGAALRQKRKILSRMEALSNE